MDELWPAARLLMVAAIAGLLWSAFRARDRGVVVGRSRPGRLVGIAYAVAGAAALAVLVLLALDLLR